MSCEGCQISSGGQRQALEAARQQAKAHGKKENIRHIAIWREGNEFFFSGAAAAFAAGKPVSEVLSIDFDAPAEQI